MNICQIIPEIAFYEDGTYEGGVENSMLRISEGLVNNSHRLFLLAGDTGNFKEEALRMFKAGDIAKVRLSSDRVLLRGMEFLIKTASKSKGILNKKKIDLIHLHSGYPHYGLIATLAKLIYKLPTVYSIYTPLGTKLEDRHNALLRLIKPNHLLRHVDRIIAASYNVKKSLEAHRIGRSKIRVISPPIDCNKFNQAVKGNEWRQRLELRKEHTTILFVGNLSKFKGLDVLVDALILLSSEYPNIKLVLALQQQNKSVFLKRWGYFREIIKRVSLEGNLIKLGAVKDMHELMAASDIFVSPLYSTESVTDYPVSLLEAMAVGKAVIASNVGGIAEIVQDKKTGILVDPGASEQLAEKIKSLIENESLVRSLGRSASDFIKENFSTQKVCLEIEKVYREVLHEHSR